MSGKAGVLRVSEHHCMVNPDFAGQSCRTLCFSNQLQDRNRNFLLGCARWSIRQLFDYLVTGGILLSNPAGAVRGPKYVVKRGKTPVLSGDEMRQLLNSIDVSV